MDYKPLQIGEKEAKIPLIQGGMGIGISLGSLAGAVAKEGAVGIISAAQPGFREPDFEENLLEANLRAIKKEYEKARRMAPEGVIGFNVMVAMNHYKEHVEAAVEAGADLIISGAGLPVSLPEYVPVEKAKIAPIVSSAKAAGVLLKLWGKKYNRTADLLIVEGPQAGGHLGFSLEELSAYEKCRESYEKEVLSIFLIVQEYEEKYKRKIPVVLAGGIDSKEAVERALELGADGVQVASRFVTTEECDADIRYKESYLKAEKEDIVLVKSPVGMPGRAIKNPFIDRVYQEKRIPPKRCYDCLKTCNPAETPYCITQALMNAARGDIENALLFCGARAWKAERIESVKEVIDSLFFSK
ncbi:NAD(P)H-dependent flavin oxidoreductase [Acetivibrio ethanolgignens]|uniref:Probable nitronate monooxygenase n=1 Tax=Acetivibrio ethanolgignens TaxID=290052 RepID=A0A0V8QD20_9FIRM|nr:nitronate monooxygenase family protein [Acetivibrio ethanolgignens]KSV58378.1 2-nitropropane dioxygenase [Acetivibrio ethanolgignens]